MKNEFADEFIGSRTQRSRKRKLTQIKAIIIHTTGYGRGLQRIIELDDDLEKIGAAYARRMADVLKYKGHFLIDHTGKIWQFISIDEIAWHTGGGKRKLLESEKPFSWWSERWKELKNPTDLIVWEKKSPNAASVGIDLLAHGNGSISKGYTSEQYQSLARVIKSLCEYLDISLERKYILGHEDVDPISRGTSKRGWDPGTFDWDKLFELLTKKDDSGTIEQEIEEPEVEKISSNIYEQIGCFIRKMFKI